MSDDSLLGMLCSTLCTLCHGGAALRGTGHVALGQGGRRLGCAVRIPRPRRPWPPR